MIAGRDAQWRGGRWWPSDGLDLAGGTGLLGSEGCGRCRGRGGGQGREALGWEAAAACDGLFRDGDGAVRRGGLRGGRRPADRDPGLVGVLGRFVSVPTSGGITQARQRLGPEPLELLFDRVAGPVAGLLTR